MNEPSTGQACGRSNLETRRIGRRDRCNRVLATLPDLLVRGSDQADPN